MAWHSAAALTEACRADLEASRQGLAALLAVSGPRTVENTLRAYDELALRAMNAAYLAGLVSETHPSPELRAAAEEADREVSKWLTELSMNRALYEAIQAVSPGDEDGDEDAETRRFVERTLRDFRRSGVDKDDATRARLERLAEREVELGQLFDRNIREDVRKLEVTRDQLRGLPEDYIAAHPPDARGLATITTDYPDYLPFRAYAEDAPARKRMYELFLSRGFPQNGDVLRELLVNRAEQAKLLGYASWGEYQLEIRMARTPRAVEEFLARVGEAAERRARRDYDELLERKRVDEPGATSVEDWERVYIEEKVKREKYDFDSQSVRPYFELGRVRDGLLAITAKLYDVEYVRAPDAEAAAWHPSVICYDVMRRGTKLGRIYLDLHPREGKYKHAAQFTLKKGVRGRQLPEGVLVCNFPDPRASQGPALMEHGDVETLFHEFGHLMHHVLGGHVGWLLFSGVANERDFTESPSVMFEEWAWDASTLALFARHVDTGEPIPAELVARMRRASEFGQGVAIRRQLALAALSLDLYTKDPAQVDLDAVEGAALARYHLFAPVPGTHFWSGFGHLNGYAAGYYVYVWSDVIARDLLGEFRRHGLLDETTARRYRDSILAPGGTADAADLVKRFLGREYGFDAFREWLEGGAAA